MSERLIKTPIRYYLITSWRGKKKRIWQRLFTLEQMGDSGHYHIGIDKTLTGAEYEIWLECDNETWINNIRKNPGRHVIKHHGEVYTNYGVPFSVDDEREGSHTELFWKGIHTKEEIVNLIKNNQFLARQFKMDEAIKKVATVCGVRYKDIKSAINMTQAFAGGKKKRI